MLKHHSRVVDAALRLSDVLMLAVSLPAADGLRDAIMGNRGGSMQMAPLLAFTVLSWFVTSWMFDVYDGYRTRPVTFEMGRTGAATTGRTSHGGTTPAGCGAPWLIGPRAPRCPS